MFSWGYFTSIQFTKMGFDITLAILSLLTLFYLHKLLKHNLFVYSFGLLSLWALIEIPTYLLPSSMTISIIFRVLSKLILISGLILMTIALKKLSNKKAGSFTDEGLWKE